MTFRIGQKVVCVDPIDDLSINRIYTIIAIGMGRFGLMVDVTNSRFGGSTGPAFYARRFRPIVERKTSIECFTAMLNTSKVEA